MKKLDPKLRRIALSRTDPVILRRDLEAAVTTNTEMHVNEDGVLPDGDVNSEKVYKRCIVSHQWSEIPGAYADLSWTKIVGDIFSVNLPIDLLEQLSSEPEIEFIEAGRSFSPVLSTSLAETDADAVHSGSGVPELTGENVIVGIIDTGLDYRLDDFRNADGSTRVAFLWDQSLVASGGEQSPSGFNYGVEYDSAAIDQAIGGADTVRHAFSIGSHGTHVAAIAAGNGRSNDAEFAAGQHVGAAPQATIIHVTPDSRDQNSSFTDSSNVADAIAYIYRKADELGLPCVINMSLGQNGGSHDGESIVERAIDQLLQVRGRAFVSAAGNEHQWRGHTSGVLSQGETKSLRWKAGGLIPWVEALLGNPAPNPELGDFTSNEMEIWFSSRDDMRVRVTTPSGETTPWAEAPFSEIHDLANGNQVFIDVERFAILNGDARIYIEIDPRASRVESGEWIVEIEGRSIADGRYDGFIERDARMHRVPLTNGTHALNYFADQSFYVGDDFDPVMTLGTPATSRKGIVVANYNHVTQAPNDSSSRGPTRDGRSKPEVAAPGTNIVAANAGGGTADANGNEIPVRVAKTGTSMSAPHVCGIVALLLELNPMLSSSQIRAILIASAASKTATNDFDPAWGYGAIDALEAVTLTTAM